MPTTHPRSGLPLPLRDLRLPIIAAPMFTVSYPSLVSAQCRAGIVGAFPVLNARPPELLRDWLQRLHEELASTSATPGPRPGLRPAPFAVNLNVNDANVRLAQDMRECLDARVPIFITSLRAPPRELVEAVHAYGGIVLHDVISLRHAEKALEAGVDGLILVAAGAGGHGGTLSPFAFLAEVRRIFDGPIALSGAISSGADVLSARTMGADLAYMGTRFIATRESEAGEDYKRTLLEARASDIVYTDYFSGVHANYLRQSIETAGLDPVHLRKPDGAPGYFGIASAAARPRNWKDIWAAGHGVGAVDDAPNVADLVDRLEAEYERAAERLLSIIGERQHSAGALTTSPSI